jgi:hypothetical protein
MAGQPRSPSHRLALVLLAVVFLIAYVVHGSPPAARRGGARVLNTPQLLQRAETANYAIYPKDTSNKDQAKAISKLLEGLVADKADIYVSDTSKGTFFWAAPLTSANAQKVAKDPNVGIWGQLHLGDSLANRPRSTGSSRNVLLIALTLQILMTLTTRTPSKKNPLLTMLVRFTPPALLNETMAMLGLKMQLKR